MFPWSNSYLYLPPLPLPSPQTQFPTQVLVSNASTCFHNVILSRLKSLKTLILNLYSKVTFKSNANPKKTLTPNP